MTILPSPHASPLPSWASRPAVIATGRQPTFRDLLMVVLRWWRGDRPSLRERFAEEKLIERLSEELPDEPEMQNCISQPTAKAVSSDTLSVSPDTPVAGRLAKPTGRPAKNRVAKKPDLPTLLDQGIDKHLADPSSEPTPVSNDTETVSDDTPALVQNRTESVQNWTPGSDANASKSEAKASPGSDANASKANANALEAKA